MLVKCAGCSTCWHSGGYAAQVCGSTLRYVERRDGQAQETCVSISRGNTTQTGSMRVAGWIHKSCWIQSELKLRSHSADRSSSTSMEVDCHRTAKHGLLACMQVGA